MVAAREPPTFMTTSSASPISAAAARHWMARLAGASSASMGFRESSTRSEQGCVWSRFPAATSSAPARSPSTARDDRGTQLTVTLQYDPAAGRSGRWWRSHSERAGRRFARCAPEASLEAGEIAKAAWTARSRRESWRWKACRTTTARRKLRVEPCPSPQILQPARRIVKSPPRHLRLPTCTSTTATSDDGRGASSATSSWGKWSKWGRQRPPQGRRPRRRALHHRPAATATSAHKLCGRCGQLEPERRRWPRSWPAHSARFVRVFAHLRRYPGGGRVPACPSPTSVRSRCRFAAGRAVLSCRTSSRRATWRRRTATQPATPVASGCGPVGHSRFKSAGSSRRARQSPSIASRSGGGGGVAGTVRSAGLRGGRRAEPHCAR